MPVETKLSRPKQLFAMLQKYFLAAFLLVAVPLCSCIKQPKPARIFNSDFVFPTETEDNVHHLPIWPTLNGESPYRRLRRQTPPTSNREQLKRCSGYYAHGAYPHGRLILYWHNMQKPRDASRYLSRIITDDLHLPQLASKVIQHDVRNGHILFEMLSNLDAYKVLTAYCKMFSKYAKQISQGYPEAPLSFEIQFTDMDFELYEDIEYRKQ